MTNQTYGYNPFPDSGVICWECGYPIAIRDKENGVVSCSDFYDHERRPNHKTKTKDRKGLAREMNENADNFVEKYYNRGETCEEDLMSSIKGDFLVPDAAHFSSCTRCQKLLQTRVSRPVKDNHRHEYAEEEQCGYAIKGWKKRYPEAVRQSDSLDGFLDQTGSAVQKRVAVVRKREASRQRQEKDRDQAHVGEMTAVNDRDSNNCDSQARVTSNEWFDCSNAEREWSMDDFELVRKKPLGEGSYGRVYLVREKKTKSLLALKVVESNPYVDREIEIQYRLCHDNIVRFYDFFKEKGKVYLMLEYCEGGSYQDRLEKLEADASFSEDEVRQSFRQIVDAVSYCHTCCKGIIHGDIKPDNILIDKDGKMKLADFGLSRFSMSRRRHNYSPRGTIEYMSPEMLKGAPSNETTDIWSLGVLLYVLLTNTFPFFVETKVERRKATYNFILSELDNLQGYLSTEVSEEAKDLILQMLTIDPKKRIALKNVKNHPWIQGSGN